MSAGDGSLRWDLVKGARVGVTVTYDSGRLNADVRINLPEGVDLERAMALFGFEPHELKAAWYQEAFTGFECWCELHGTDWEPEFFVPYEDWHFGYGLGAEDIPF